QNITLIKGIIGITITHLTYQLGPMPKQHTTSPPSSSHTHTKHAHTYTPNTRPHAHNTYSHKLIPRLTHTNTRTHTHKPPPYMLHFSAGDQPTISPPTTTQPSHRRQPSAIPLLSVMPRLCASVHAILPVAIHVRQHFRRLRQPVQLTKSHHNQRSVPNAGERSPPSFRTARRHILHSPGGGDDAILTAADSSRRRERSRSPRKRARTPEKEELPQKRGIIHMIFGGSTDGDSNRARKAYARGRHGKVEVQQVDENGPVMNFGPADVGEVERPHNDALMITAQVSGYEVQRVFVNTGSSVNVIFYDCLKRMELDIQLTPLHTSLFGFNRSEVAPLEETMLAVVLGEGDLRKVKMVRFVVVD
ncbi:Unknown protein, partial [Striga hermonthica]